MLRRRTGRERHVGSVYVDSGQILILEPGRLGSEAEYQRVVEVTLAAGAGEVWLRDYQLPVRPTADGVAVGTDADGAFPVFVTYDRDGTPTSIRIALS